MPTPSLLKKLFLALLMLSAAILLCKSLSSIRGEDRFSLDLFAKTEEKTGPFFPQDLLQPLDQPFHYIGHGAQAVAFVSEDQNYVIKFFLMRNFEGNKRFKIKSPFRMIPSYRKRREEEKAARHARNLQKVVNRYQVAFEKLKEETALLAMHFHQTADLPPCTLYDRRGKKWQIDLNDVAFVVQKKAQLLADCWKQCATDAEKEEILHTIAKFLEKRASKGFADVGERFFIANYGFLENDLILIDSGRIEYSEEVANNPAPAIQEMKKRVQEAFNY